MTTTPLTHCRLQRDDSEGEVDRITLDVADAGANPMSLELIEDLHRALDTLAHAPPARGLVLDSAKAAGFAVGLSRDTLARIEEGGHMRALIERGQALTARLAAWPVPTVAVLHGGCQGGGLELALAADYRVAAEPGTVLSFPEIHLGMHPYLGGTARLGDTIGLTPALRLLLSGHNVGLDEAERLGLFDVRAARADVDHAIHDLLTRQPRRCGPHGWRRLVSLAPVRWTMELVRRADDRERVIPAAHPASTALYQLWWRHGSESTERRIGAEARSALRLFGHPSTRNLARIFVLRENLRDEARFAAADPFPDRVHMVGCGEIGSEIATVLASAGIAVSVEDQDESRQAQLRDRIDALYRVELGDGEELEARRAQLDDGPDGAAPDIVIEAVVEDRATKEGVLQELAARFEETTPIATTTSTLPVSELAAELPRPERCLGLHFQISMTSRALAPLTEVVQARQTDAATLERGRALVAAIDRLPLVVRDSPGFLVNRLLLPYLLAGAERYARPQREVIDGAGHYMGMAAGPLELADWIGLDRCTALAQHAGLELPPSLQWLVDAGHYGCRSGQGFHDWRGYRRVTAALPPRHERIDRLGPELIEPIAEEAARCREEGLVASDDLLDLGAVAGAGFPAYTGGPLQYRAQHGPLAQRGRREERDTRWWRRLLDRMPSRQQRE